MSISWFTLICSLAILSGCSTYEKEAQRSPLVRAERQLERAERIRSDPQQKSAEILSVAETAASEIPKTNGETNSSSERSIGLYNRATADFACELPELAPGGDSLGSLMIQNRKTGETYRVRLGPPRRGEYSPAYFQKLLNAETLRVRRGEQTAVRPGVGGTVVGIHHSVPPGSPPPRLELPTGYRVPVTSIIEFDHLGDSVPIKARLSLIDPRKRDTVEIRNDRYSLAANFSAPLLSYGRVNEIWLGFINMIRGDVSLWDMI